MATGLTPKAFVAASCWTWCALMCAGCATVGTQNLGLDSYEIPQGQFAMAPVVDGTRQPPSAPPTELDKVSLPDYIIEPPDILLIEGIKVVPKTPYEIQPQDILQIVVLGTTPDRPIAGQFLVEPSGIVHLGPGYGSVKIAGLTTDEAAEAIRKLLLRDLNTVDVAVSLFQIAGQQLITGEHLVSPDGTVNLGLFGRIYIAGMSLDEARAVIEEKLSERFEDPKISLDVFVYNSKFFYVINEGGGFGETVARIPITGNETVLDAIAQIGGLDQTASTKLWISRPAPSGAACDQVLPIDWKTITRGAATSTNYQLLPGDRLFIAQDRLVAFNSAVSKLLNPFERAIGFTLLTSQTIQNLQRFPQGFTTGF